jgi:hypothetical protein
MMRNGLVGPLLMHENDPERLRDVDRHLTFTLGIAKGARP